MKNKLNFIDNVFRYVAPAAFNSRIQARAKADLLARQYDAAVSYPQSPLKRPSTSANGEVRNAIAPVRNSARELVRNAPFAKKALDVITNGTIGWGIEASIKHADLKKQNQIKDLWKTWSSAECSVDSSDLYQLQNQVMAAIVSDGESLIRIVVLDGSVRLQILEADYLATHYSSKDQTGLWKNGILIDEYSRPKAYAIYTHHPGDGISTKIEIVDAKEIIHVFRQDRPGQNRGISWFANAIQSINMLSELQWTQLLRMKLSSAVTAIVTAEQSTLPPEMVKANRESDWEVEAGTVKYLNPGEKIEFPAIPNAEGFGPATRLVLQEVASGLGITYEALSCDLSQVNFSSGRLGDLQFRANVDQWRWHMFIPRFCNQTFKVFLRYCNLKGIDTSGVEVSWTPPARQMIDPTSEVSSTNAAIRAGLQTLPSALRELGIDPETHLKEMSESNDLVDSLGLVLDSDPRRTGNQQLQAPDSYQAIESDQASTKPRK